MKIILIFICTCFLWTRSNAQVDTSGTGKVNFIRNNALKNYKFYKFFMDDAFLCKIAEHSYFIKNISEGKHSFSVQFNGKKSKKNSEKLLIDIKPGKQYFIELILQEKWPIPNIYCIEVVESSAMRILPTLKLSTRCD